MKHRKHLFSALALVMMAAMLLSPALPTAQAAPLAQPEAPQATGTFRDTFTTAAYNNNDGTINWSTSPWVETDSAGGGAGGGNVQITGGELRMENSGSSIYRQANLSGATRALFSFEYNTSGNLEADSTNGYDRFRVEVSPDGGNMWVLVDNYYGDVAGGADASNIYDISPYIASNTRIRFSLVEGYNGTSEFIVIDNVQIETDPAVPLGADYFYHPVDEDGGVFGDQHNEGGACFNPVIRYFTVYDDFDITDLDVGINLTHPTRGQVRITLESPAGTLVEIVSSGGDTNDNYDLYLDDESANLINDGNADNPRETYYDRTAAPSNLLSVFDAESPLGFWKLVACDTVNSSDTRQGMFNHARLVFTGPANPLPPPVTPEPVPAPVQIYFVPLPENQAEAAFNTIYPVDTCQALNGFPASFDTFNKNPQQPVINYSGISIGTDGTILLYDQYEDGYEIDVTERTQQSSEIWGDGDLNNGVAPELDEPVGSRDDLLQAGDVLIIKDVVETTSLNNPNKIDYGARDRVSSSDVIAMTRAAWSAGSATLLAGALELFPVQQWGTDFEVPVGENSNVNGMFEYVGVTVMAVENGTTVLIDSDNNGSNDVTCNLNKGESCQVNGGIDVGASIDGDKPIQVHMITGDQCAGFESRWFTLLPDDQLDDEWFVPVGAKTTNAAANPGGIADDTPAYAHIYNPSGGTITVNWQTQSGAQASFNVGSEARVNRTIPAGEGARFYTTGGTPPVFNVVVTVDSENAAGSNQDRNDTTDWGFTAVPERQLSNLLLAGMAFGYDPEYLLPVTPIAYTNASPVWLTAWNPTPVEATTDVCVDYNADGGANTDPGTGFQYDQQFSVADLDSFIIYDNSDGDNNPDTGDLDQSAMFIFVCNGSAGRVAAAWGQDSNRAFGGSPAIDVGTTIPGGRAFATSKDAELFVDLNGNDLYDPGDTIRYTVLVKNVGATAIPANTINVQDLVPADTAYVLNTTEYEDTGGTTAIPDDANPNEFPLLPVNLGWNYPNALAIGAEFEVRFQVVIDVPSCTTIYNRATVTGDEIVFQPDVEVPCQPPQLGAIGNYVWFDEDGDGDQDAGESGIPNVQVDLYQDSGAGYVLVATTYTDANGGYLFDGLFAGNYRVDVVTATLPDPDGAGPGGLYQTYDEDNGTGPFTTPDSTTVSLGSGVEHLTADFGYNWAPAGDTNNPPPGALGAIGDRVWIDSNGDGVQDAGESGIPNVTVELWYDSNGDGDVDAQYGTTSTNAAGNYIFDELPPGIYEVRIPTPPVGYNQTGDPDNFGAPCGAACDNQTTTPIVLAPGDVFLNADFGYQPIASFSIGNLVFLDANADGNYDPNGNDGNPGTTADNEYGIPGVTVALIRDNGNGIYEPGIDPIVATTITDASGGYLFDGLPNGTQYFVWVNDTDNVLGEVQQSAEPGPADGGQPCGACNDVSPLVVPVGPNNLLQDFGYTPVGQTPALGAIGDTVFLDANNDSNFDQGEGLEGVVVVLFDQATGNKLAQTTTDENGHYYFGGLDPNNVTYVVQVQTSTLPNGGVGLTNHVDPDGGGNSTSTWTLTPGAPINLDQDFGYIPANPGSIGNYIWEDSNADGVNNEPASNGIGGVTVDLYEDSNNNGIVDSGDHLVGQTTTASDGSYLFTQLPPGNYLVDVTDDAQVLNGYWHSLGDQTPGVDDNSKQDPYKVTLAAGENYIAADFGYYVQPAAVGNFVWLDSDQDGIQDVGEAGIPNVVVKMLITYPNGDTTTLTAVTDSTGYYSFGNLLQDEDYNGTGTYGLEPTYIISIDTTQTALIGSPYPTLINAPGSTVYNDSNDPAGTPASPVQGQTDTSAANDLAGIASYDFGFTNTPLAVILADFSATGQVDHILVTWETVSELDNAGFNLYRGATDAAPDELLANIASQAPGSAQGYSYSYQDFAVEAGQQYFYWLEAVDFNGSTSLTGPVDATMLTPTAVTLSNVEASGVEASNVDAVSNATNLLWLVVVAVGLALAAVYGLRRGMAR